MLVQDGVHFLAAAHEYGGRGPVGEQVDGCLDGVEAIAFAEHEAARRGGAGHRADGAHQLVVPSHPVLELVAVGVPVGDCPAGHSGVDGGLGYGHRDTGDQARVEGLGNQVFAAEGDVVVIVCCGDDVGHRLLGQRGERFYGGYLHRVVDLGRANVERSSEDVGETEQVVHLVGVVGASGGEDDVGTGPNRDFVAYLGVGVRKGEDHGVLGHAAHHVGGEHVGH